METETTPPPEFRFIDDDDAAAAAAAVPLIAQPPPVTRLLLLYILLFRSRPLFLFLWIYNASIYSGCCLEFVCSCRYPVVTCDLVVQKWSIECNFEECKIKCKSQVGNLKWTFQADSIKHFSNFDRPPNYFQTRSQQQASKQAIQCLLVEFPTINFRRTITTMMRISLQKKTR